MIGIRGRVRAPDFVGVGTQRSGTSWWFATLQRHPQISPGTESRKELHYFDRFCREGFGAGDIAAYHAKFPGSGGLLRGEWTPRYMCDFWTPRLLSRAAPEARLLVLLRDPVERYRSGVEHESVLNGGDRLQQLKLIVNVALERSRYHRQLTRLLDYFPRSQLLLLQYERCVADPRREFRRTLDFLGAAEFELDEAELRKTAGTVTRRSELPAQLREALVGELGQDVSMLRSDFPELDLGLWPDFAIEQSGAPSA